MLKSAAVVFVWKSLTELQLADTLGAILNNLTLMESHSIAMICVWSSGTSSCGHRMKIYTVYVTYIYLCNIFSCTSKEMGHVWITLSFPPLFLDHTLESSTTFREKEGRITACMYIVRKSGRNWKKSFWDSFFTYFLQFISLARSCFFAQYQVYWIKKPSSPFEPKNLEDEDCPINL